MTLSGTAGATTGIVTGSGATYNLAVSGMTETGTVIVSLPAGVTHDSAGNDNPAATSTDNSVTYTPWSNLQQPDDVYGTDGVKPVMRCCHQLYQRSPERLSAAKSACEPTALLRRERRRRLHSAGRAHRHQLAERPPGRDRRR